MVTPETDTFDPTDDQMLDALGWTDDGGASDDDQDEPAPSVATDTPPVTTPTAAPEAAPVAAPVVDTPTTPVDDFQRQQEAQQRQQQDQTVYQHIENQAAQYMSQLEDQGLDRQTAYNHAKVWAEGQWGRWEGVKATDQARKSELNAKRYEISQRYSTPIEQLQGFDNAAAMEQHARLYHEINQVRQEAARPNMAPIQTFDNNRMTASNSPDALTWRYASDSDFNPTPEQFKAMGLS